MRRLRLVAVLVLCMGLLAPASSARKAKVTGSVQLTKEGGLGRLETHRDLAAVLGRDEGIVTLLSLEDPDRPKVLGAYDDDARQSLDGDLAFSSDGKWLFYARQTVQFSLDGIHVLDVSDPSTPSLASYAPGGGAYRIETYNDGTTEWVVLLDAINGLVVYRFVPETGQLVPVFADPMPLTEKVGGPASAGLYIDTKDSRRKSPLLYVTTGGAGLQIYDLAEPTSPTLIGAVPDEGLAEVEVTEWKGMRLVAAATEYWFDKTSVPAVILYDATELNDIRPLTRLGAGARAVDEERVQGMTLFGDELVVAHSSLGLVRLSGKGSPATMYTGAGRLNPGAGVLTAPYVFDVEAARDRLYVTDAATGTLTVLRP